MKRINSFSFGDNGKNSDDLLSLVLLDKKRATSSLYYPYISKNLQLPKTGDKNIVLDSKGVARCLIAITKVSVKPFNKISAAFASKEGEGDRSLNYWRRVHKKFLAKKLKKMGKKFDENVLVVCEEFKVLKVLN